jgi:aminoglycoside phosphotransferase (APT) family kinase protein
VNGLDPVRVLRVFPTTSGLRVELAAAADERLVIVKSADDPACCELLVSQARQMDALTRILGRPVFPPVLAVAPGRMVIEYAPGEALREAAADLGQDEITDVQVTAVRTVFGLSAAGPRGPSGRGFLAAELRRRTARVGTALGRSGPGLELPGPVAKVGTVIDRWDEELAPARLGLGVHGDLTPQNVVYGGPAGRTTLIDPRGQVRWESGRPWWDPAFDLAAMVAFHAVVDRLPGIGAQAAAARADALYADLVARCSAAPGVAAWSRLDPAWPRRGRVAVLIRLLGNVSVQLRHFPADGQRRARTLLDTCSALAESLMGDL